MRGLFLAVVVSLSAGSARAATLECRDLPLLFQLFQREHYSRATFDDRVRDRTAEQFIKIIDPSKTLLLAGELPGLKADLRGVFQTMLGGHCPALDKTMQTVIQRAEENERLVREWLGPKYKLDETAQVIVDPDKIDFPRTADERKQRLRDLIHFQMHNYMSSKLSLDDAKKQLVHRYELAAKRLRDRQQKGVVPGYFAEAFALALDPHSTYLSMDELNDFNIQMRLSLEGIGALLRWEDGFTVIESLVPGGSAERSGKVLPNDKIIAVAQGDDPPVAVIDMDLDEVVKLIRGKKGTRVRLTILREGGEKGTTTAEAVIVRDKIDVSSQAAKLTYETRKVDARDLKIGVLELPSFYGGDESGRSSYADVERLLREANTNKVDGLVLDLSRNGGGLLEDAVRIAGLFIREGNIVATKNASTKVEVLADEDERVVYGGPLVILVSPVSASASEILAGALKDYRRALVVGGQQTFGKGSVQVVAQIPGELGAMKVTTSMFFLPGGASTQSQGVRSDVRIPSVLDGYDMSEAKLDNALQPETIRPFVSREAQDRWRGVDAATVAALVAKSAARVAGEAFAEVRKRLDEMARDKGVVKLAELRKRDKENGTKDEDPKAGEKLDKVVLAEAVNVAADLAAAGTQVTAR